MSLRDVAEALRDVTAAAERLALVPIPTTASTSTTSTAAVTDDLLREQRRSGVINIGGQ